MMIGSRKSAEFAIHRRARLSNRRNVHGFACLSSLRQIPSGISVLCIFWKRRAASPFEVVEDTHGRMVAISGNVPQDFFQFANRR
jgi:hypothetical protein